MRAPRDRVERDDVVAVDMHKKIIGGSAAVVGMVVGVVTVVGVFAAVMTVVIVVWHG